MPMLCSLNSIRLGG